jgi:acetoin utilization protein AcuC
LLRLSGPLKIPPGLLVDAQPPLGFALEPGGPVADAVPRVSTTLDLCRAMGWLPPARFRLSPRAKPAALTIWHDADYIAALERAETRQQVTEEERHLFHLGTANRSGNMRPIVY